MLKMKSSESLRSRSWLVTFLRALMQPPVLLRPLVVKISTWESCQLSIEKNWSHLLLFAFTSFLIRWLMSSHLNLIRQFRTGLIHFRTTGKFSVSWVFRWIEIFGELKFSEYLTDNKPRKLVQDKPNITYSDIGGLDSQKQEVREAVELPLTHMNMYKSIGIDPPRKHSKL